MAKVKKTKTSKFFSTNLFFNYWGKENYILLGIGILLIIAGNYLLSIKPWDSSASLNIAPIVLLIAYIVVLPLSIFYRKKKDKTEEDAASQS